MSHRPKNGLNKLWLVGLLWSHSSFAIDIPQEVIAEVQEKGNTHILVKLNLPWQAEGYLNSIEEVLAQRQAIAQVQTQLEATVQNGGVILKYETIPYVAMQVDATSLQILQQSQFVTDITLETPDRSSKILPLVGTSYLGQTIALIDTGFTSPPPLVEGCYSSTLTDPLGPVSKEVCPNRSTAPGAGQACNIPMTQCNHGTQVAELIAAMAPEAKLLSMQVFSEYLHSADCLPELAPCILSRPSDQLAALERIYTLHHSGTPISTVILGVRGNKKFTPDCNEDPRKAIIDNLSSVGVTTVTAEEEGEGLSAPACIASVVKTDPSENFLDSSVRASTRAARVKTNNPKLLFKSLGTFLPWPGYVIGDTNRYRKGNFNGDGKEDIFHLADAGNNSFTYNIWLSKGGEGKDSFTVVPNDRIPNFTTGVGDITRYRVGDFNGDGKADLMGLFGTIWIALSKGDGTFNFAYDTQYAVDNINNFRIGDFDGNSVSDILHLVPPNQYRFGLFQRTTLPNYIASIITIENGVASDTGRYSVGNFDGQNGTSDILFLGTNNFIHTMLLQKTLPSNPNGAWAYYATAYPIGDPTAYLPGDFNGDGALDLVNIKSIVDSTNVYIVVGLSNKDGTFRLASYTLYGGTEIGRYRTGDFNGDGKTDLLYFFSTSELHIGLSNGNGTFEPLAISDLVVESDLSRYRIGDFTGDGRTDILHFMSTGAEILASTIWKEPLTITIAGGGTVTSTPVGIHCTPTCSAQYDGNTSVTLTATAALNHQFASWSGSCTGTSLTTQVIMNAAKTCTANFVYVPPPQYNLTINKTGNGTVTGTGINCGADCNESYVANTQVSLTATAATGYQFVSWTGSCTGTSLTTQVIMNAAQTCTANFYPILTVKKTGRGKVTGTGINCGDVSGNPDCNELINTQVILTATPYKINDPEFDYQFMGWSGDCTGTSNPLTVIMNSAKVCTAIFKGPPTSATCNDKDLIACYAFDYNANDGSGYDRHGTPSGVVLDKDRDGKTNAYKFNGSDSYVEVKDDINLGTLFSMSAWIQVPDWTTGTSFRVILSKADKLAGSDHYEIYLMKNDTSPSSLGEFRFFAPDLKVNGTPLDVGIGKQINNQFANQFHHVAVTYDGNKVKLFLDGVKTKEVLSVTGTIPSTGNTPNGSRPLFIGKQSDGSTNPMYFKGIIDEVHIYNRALTEDEVKQLVKFTLTVETNGSRVESDDPKKGGISCWLDCKEEYVIDTKVTLKAIDYNGYNFLNWGKDCTATTSSEGTITSERTVVVVMDKSKTCTANFNFYQPPPPTYYTLTVTRTGKGTVKKDGSDCNNGCSQSYLSGSGVNLTSTPEAGYITLWGGVCKDGASSCSVYMNQAKTVNVSFAPSLNLGVQKNGTGEGKIDVDSQAMNKYHSNINCGDICSMDYPEGASVTLTATPASGSKFMKWSGGCTENGSITLNEAKTCTATFEKIFPLKIHPKPLNGLVESGSVDENGGFKIDGLIKCRSGNNSECEISDYLINTEVTLGATADSGYLFTGWMGSCKDLPHPATLTMDAAKTCTANFELPKLTVSKTGEGTIISTPTGITCGTDCEEAYPLNTLVTLTATPGTNYQFSGWSGDCSPIENQPLKASVTINAAKNCKATFKIPSPTTMVTLTINKIGNGTITGTGDLNCKEETCTKDYQEGEGTEVTLTAQAGTGWQFSGWSGDCSPIENQPLKASVTMNAAKTCKATFKMIPSKLTLNKVGMGTVEVVPPGTLCGTDCQEYEPDTSIQLNATPELGYQFKEWGSDCKNLPNPATLRMDKAKTCTANFEPVPTTTPTLNVKVEYESGGTGNVQVDSVDKDGKVIDSSIIKCGGASSSCSKTLSSDAKVRLIVTPGPTSIPTWVCDNGKSSPTDSITLTLDKDLTCTATFKGVPSHTLTLKKQGQGGVTAKRESYRNNELTCSTAGECTVEKMFPEGVNIVVWATPDPGFATNWSGDCQLDPKKPDKATISKGNFNNNKSCVANFVRDVSIDMVTLSVQLSGSEGIVLGNARGGGPGLIRCDGKNNGKNICMAYYEPGTEVKLTAQPAPFSTFKGWSGNDCVLSPPSSPSSLSPFVKAPQQGGITCIATFGDFSENTVSQFCKTKGAGGAYSIQGNKNISANSTFICNDSTNKTLLKEAFRLAYPVKMTMEAQQVVTGTWPNHFSTVTSWYNNYPNGITNIRPLTDGSVEIQLMLKDGNYDTAVTISYGRNPIDDGNGNFLFKRDDSYRFKHPVSGFKKFAKDTVDDFYLALDNHEAMVSYNRSRNQERLQNAFWLALPVIMTVEENLRLGYDWPPGQLNNLSWYDLQPSLPGVKNIKLTGDKYIEIQVTLLNDNNEEKDVNILVYYGGKPNAPNDVILYPRKP